MNAQNAHEYLPLVQALADGKTIQFNYEEDGWKDTESVELQYSAKYYRVKPEPRTFDVWIHKNGEGIQRQIPHSWMNENNSWERITVQEVLEARTLKPE